MDKKPWTSKTIIIAAILGVTSALSPFIPALSGVAAFINNNAIIINSVIWPVLMIALRAISKGAIVLGE